MTREHAPAPPPFFLGPPPAGGFFFFFFLVLDSLDDIQGAPGAPGSAQFDESPRAVIHPARDVAAWLGLSERTLNIGRPGGRRPTRSATDEARFRRSLAEPSCWMTSSLGLDSIRPSSWVTLEAASFFPRRSNAGAACPRSMAQAASDAAAGTRWPAPWPS